MNQTAATCTAKGTSKYTCSCGYSYTSQDIAALGHSYAKNEYQSSIYDYVNIKTDVTWHRKCLTCGATTSKVICESGDKETMSFTNCKGKTIEIEYWNGSGYALLNWKSSDMTAEMPLCNEDTQKLYNLISKNCSSSYSHELIVMNDMINYPLYGGKTIGTYFSSRGWMTVYPIKQITAG